MTFVDTQTLASCWPVIGPSMPATATKEMHFHVRISSRPRLLSIVWPPADYWSSASSTHHCRLLSVEKLHGMPWYSLSVVTRLIICQPRTDKTSQRRLHYVECTIFVLPGSCVVTAHGIRALSPNSNELRPCSHISANPPSLPNGRHIVADATRREKQS